MFRHASLYFFGSLRMYCSQAPTAGSMEPGVWLQEACYKRLLEELRGRKRITVEEKIKLAESEFRLGEHAAALADAQSVLVSSPGSGWGVY